MDRLENGVEWMPVNARRIVKPLLVAVAAYGLAGCVTQLPWELPDPYSSGSAGGSSPYYYGSGSYGSGSYGSGSYGYGSRYYGGEYYGDPYYQYRRGGVGLPYPGYGYAPYYPGYTCWDTNRDGRCDRRRDDDDGHQGGGGGGDDDAGNGGGRPDSDRPLRDVRRLIREREQERRARPGSTPDAATLRSVPLPTGETPKVRVPARVQAPVSAPPRVEPRRPSDASAPPRARSRPALELSRQERER
jgi:hypothetical protein